MKRATITVPDDLEEPIEAFSRDQDVPPAFTSIVQIALREFLRNRGYLPALDRHLERETRRDWLKQWATWTEDEAREFDEALKSIRVIDEELWH